MKKSFLVGFGGFITGVLVSLVAMWLFMPSLMLIESESKYSFDETMTVYKESVQKKGWKIPVIHDLQKTMKKFDKDVAKVQVVELCHPQHAYAILSKDMERIVSSMMPCRVAFYEKTDGKTYISRMNTALLGKMMAGVIPEVMANASKDSEDMLSSVLAK